MPNVCVCVSLLAFRCDLNVDLGSNSAILEVEEEWLVKSYYAKKIQETCGRDSADEDLRRSDKVQVCDTTC